MINVKSKFSFFFNFFNIEVKNILEILEYSLLLVTKPKQFPIHK